MDLIVSYLHNHPYLTTGFAVFTGGFFLSKVITAFNRKSFKGKVVIITGASSGIGEELAYLYAKQGSKIVLAARRADRLALVVEKCKSFGAQVIAVSTDVSKEEDCKNLIEEAVKNFGGIDLLLLNAGQGCLLKASEINNNFEPFRKTVDINLFGCVYPTVFALPHLRLTRGNIGVVSSLASKIPTPRRTIYGASKAAVNFFFNALRVEEPTITISVICPGFVVSEIHDRAFAPEKGVQRNLKKFMATDRCAEIIADTIATGKREEVMTPTGKFGTFLSIFLPSVADWIASRLAESSVKAK